MLGLLHEIPKALLLALNLMDYSSRNGSEISQHLVVVVLMEA